MFKKIVFPKASKSCKQSSINSYALRDDCQAETLHYHFRTLISLRALKCDLQISRMRACTPAQVPKNDSLGRDKQVHHYFALPLWETVHKRKEAVATTAFSQSAYTYVCTSVDATRIICTFRVCRGVLFRLISGFSGED